MNDPRLHDDRTVRELKEAGYTSGLGALVFCLIAAILGATLGSVYLAIAFNALFGQEWETMNMLAGGSAGALAAVSVALFKIWQGNLDARESVDDAAWRRLVHELRRPGTGGRH